jgi:hypothetical protein
MLMGGEREKARRTINWLVEEEDVGLFVPGVRVWLGCQISRTTFSFDDCARACRYLTPNKARGVLSAAEGKGSGQASEPSSMKRPMEEEPPGPPLIHMTTSSSSGLERDSKK